MVGGWKAPLKPSYEMSFWTHKLESHQHGVLGLMDQLEAPVPLQQAAQESDSLIAWEPGSHVPLFLPAGQAGCQGYAGRKPGRFPSGFHPR